MPLDLLAQRGQRQVGGVDDQIGALAQPGGQGFLRRDPVPTRPCGASG